MTLLILIVEASLRVSAVAAIVALILAAARVRSSGVRHTAWTAVLCAMLLMPVLPSMLPSFTVAIPVPRSSLDPVVTDIRGVFADPVGPALAPTTSIVRPASEESAGFGHDRQVPAHRPFWPSVALGVYGLGVIVLLSRLLIGWLGMVRVARASTAIGPRADGVFQSDLVSTPLTIGVCRPRVVLPTAWSSWPAEKLRAVLAHERAHVARHDPLIALAAHVNRCAFWFHPLSWWLERKLATTAEHACDDAGVRAMGQARGYAEVLVDIADSVRRRGRRVARQGIGVDGNGLLSQRIDRILRGDALRDISRTRKWLVTVGCAAAIVIGVACRQALTAAPLQEDPAIAQRLAQRQAAMEFSKAAQEMTTQQVDALETSLKQQPDDLVALKQVLTFYRWSGQRVLGWNEMIAARRPHILWLVEHHPESDLSLWQMSAANDPTGYAEAKRLWLMHTSKPDVSTTVLGNAAAFFQESDKTLAEQLLLRAQAIDPGGPQPRVRDNVYYPSWTSRLGTLYALVLVGSNDSTIGNVVKSTSVDQAHSAYAQAIRGKLAASQDARLLLAVGMYLTSNATNAKTDFDHVALGKSYLERSASLTPQQDDARQQLARLAMRDQHQRLYGTLRAKELELVGGTVAAKARAGQALTEAEQRTVADAEERALATLSEVERFALLTDLADGNYMSAEYEQFTKHDEVRAKTKWDRSKRYAEEVLAMAAKFKDAPNFGAAMFRANIALGTHALREGDKNTAVRYLLEAADAPASDEPDYAAASLEGRLVNYLLKAGDRDSVVDFLERSAPKMGRAKEQFLADAAAIRAGRMTSSYQAMMTAR